MKKFDLQGEKVQGLQDMARDLIDRQHYAKNLWVVEILVDSSSVGGPDQRCRDQDLAQKWKSHW